MNFPTIKTSHILFFKESYIYIAKRTTYLQESIEQLLVRITEDDAPDSY